MNPFSFLLIGILVGGIFFNRNLKKYYMFVFTVTAIIDLYVLQGDFLIVTINYRTINIDYLVFMHVILFMFSLLVIFTYHINKKSIYILLLFIVSVLVGIAFESLKPFDTKIIATNLYSWDLYYANGIGKDYPEISERALFWGVKLISYIFAVVVLKNIFTVQDLKKACTRIVNAGLLMIPLGFFELITKQRGFNIVDNFTTYFFGIGYRNSILFREGYIALKGFSAETGTYASSLGHLGILLIVESAYNLKRKKIWFFPLLIMLVISMAFTGVYFCVIICFFYFVYHQKAKEKKLPIRGICLGIMTVILLLFVAIKFFPDFYLSKRIIETVNQLSYIIKGDIRGYGRLTSEMIRLSSFRDELLWFLQRPLFGLGFGTTQCFSGVVSSLANIGIVGMFFWWKLNLHQSSLPQKKKDRGGIFLIISLITVMNLFIGNISMLSELSSFVIIALMQSNSLMEGVEE